MGEENNEYGVFLCYAWENKDKADSLHEAMKAACTSRGVARISSRRQ